jgi:hypothetical protein
MKTQTPTLSGSRMWVAITAHQPLKRINSLINTIQAYLDYELEVKINIYVDYESEKDVETLKSVLEPYFSRLDIEIKVCGPEYSGWELTWAHKTDLVLACMNYTADFYVYQENDMVLTYKNLKYWFRWKNRLSETGFEPGFVRYEEHEGKKIPFDNYHTFSLTRETPNVWHDIGFNVKLMLVVDPEIKFFAQVSNPYYGAMILDQQDAIKYVKSQSMDPVRSYELVGVRNWPLADRSSMGLAFEGVPRGYEHRRWIPVVEKDGRYVPHECCLIKHDDTKYTQELLKKSSDLMGAHYVSVCYVLNGRNYQQTLLRDDAYRLRRFIRQELGTVYWFNPA